MDADGDLVHPYITWFIDCATKAITGVAVTPGCPTRASVLAALRSAIVCTDAYGPFGGLPEHVRFDRGRDFLSRTVTTALTTLDANITVLPPYSPHLKGSIENLNRATERMPPSHRDGCTIMRRAWVQFVRVFRLGRRPSVC
ncbi:hypothetical protein [Embleya sp. NPDC005575]|uniref:hypothetical protein n=1 Tax=Embleya sp. NPDC005575 TaxID=3156892 RepID=UPI0033B1D568